MTTQVVVEVLQEVPLETPPAIEQVVELRMDSFVRRSDAAHHPLGAVPAPEVLSAERPMLLLRTGDERLFVYRLQLHVAVDDSSNAAPQLCLCRQPFDWLR
jgi:hypothetical protein